MSINGVIGLPRSGKSTFLAKLAKKYQKKGLTVYSNFYIQGCYQLDFDLLGKVDYHDCVMLIDEIALFADCRNFKEFSKDLVYFFTNHGHYNIQIWWCSQSTDCDKKIRNLTESLYYVRPAPFGFSYLRRIEKSINTETMTDCYKLTGFPKLVWRKRYYKMFDSYCRRHLPDAPAVPWDSPIGQKTAAPDPPSFSSPARLRRQGGAPTGAQAPPKTKRLCDGGREPLPPSRYFA